jgi:urate oxidase / 2-oxo-4-hydroxy-4-carboxy-5-ureidoimidazoline decarboxylase
VEQFKSGWKRSYYGKGDVIAYRLRRGDTPGGRVFGANVMLLTYGDAFWPTYTTGDNTGLIATDSMKNFIQRETLNFDGDALEAYVHFLGSTFVARYSQVAGVKVSASQLPYAPLEQGVGFEPAANDRAGATIEIDRTGVVELVSSLRGFRLLRLSGSAFHGFVRDEYTTLPDLFDRPLHMWMDLEWRYLDTAHGLADNTTPSRIRAIVRDVFESFESGSIQQVIYAMGTRILQDLPAIAEVHLEANNRTWDTVVEEGGVGIYTDPRPPFGCLGLRLTR